MAKVQGHCDPKFEKVKALFQEYIETGEENGAGITANIDGKIVIDIWGGYADEDKKQPWGKDTIVNVWSSTKTVAALAVLMCADRGLLSPYDKVAKHWPEFAENGKENIEIRHLLSHTSGLSAWDKPFEIEDLYDLEKSYSIAGQAEAVVGARHSFWLSRTLHGSSSGRSRSQSHWEVPHPIRSRRDRWSTRGRLSNRSQGEGLGSYRNPFTASTASTTRDAT